MNKTLIIIVALIIAVSSAAQQRKPRKAEPFNNLKEAQNYLNQQVKRGLFSGVVLATLGSQVMLHEAYGMANIEEGIRMKTDSKINIGSINKAFTAVSVMQLVESGLLALDDHLLKYIPELKAEMTDEITIRHLLEMKSGYGSYWDSEMFFDRRKKLRNIEDYLPIILEYPLNFKPGTNRQYSNTSYELLGIVVQRISGENYYDYVQKNVYDKAGMQNTGAFERDKVVDKLAQGYTRQKPGAEIDMSAEITSDHPYQYNVLDRSPIRGTAAGGGYSTAADLQKFVRALTDNKLLSEQSSDLVINHFRNYEDRKPVYKARGGSLGINAEVYYNADKDLTIIVMVNVDPPVASATMNRLEATLDPKEKNPLSDKQQIEEVIERFKSCIQNKDKDAFLELFVDDSKVCWVGNGSLGSQYSGPAAFINMLSSSTKTYREDFHNVDIQFDEKIATVNFDYGFFANDNLMNWGKEAWFLINQNGRWKITGVIYSMIMPREKAYPY